MLTVKVLINGQEIDRIDIQNVGNWHKDMYMYEVKNKPIERKFFHNRKHNWKWLVKQVICHLIDLEQMDEVE